MEPYLNVIAAWCRNGATDMFISEKLGVSVTSLNAYKKQFPELLKSLLPNKEFADLEVENAFHRIATGYTFEEVKESIIANAAQTFDVKEEVTSKVGGQSKRTTITKKHVKPDFRAIRAWLASRQPEKWGKDVQNRENVADEQLAALYDAMTPEERKELFRELREGNQP